MKKATVSKQKPIQVGLMGLCLTCFAILPADAAERIYVRYSMFERSITVKSLEIYAREGRYTDDLATYGRFLKPEQLEQVRNGLLQPVELDALTISQFLYTPIGERLLARVSEVIQPKSGLQGFYALRSALILSATEEEGLTALNVFKNYPTTGIQVNLGAGLSLFDQVQQLVKQTNFVVASIKNASQAQALSSVGFINNQIINFGSSAWEKNSYDLTDNSQRRQDYTGRSRNFPIDVYLPLQATPQPFPIVVISHGLNSDRTSFVYLAEHLASHGFAVVVPEHPGSNRDQIEALLNGQANDVISRTEFLDRPLDVSFALDVLQQRAQQSPQLNGKLDFDRVGVIGQSFGGYTALALSGAKLNFEHLRSDCAVNLEDTLNLSLLLQCLALRVPARDYTLFDPRIKAVIAMNPVDSSLFGPEGISQIKMPLLMVGGSADTVSPLVPEQVTPYRWLKNSNHYFALVDGGTHFSFIESGETDVDIPELQALLGQRPDIAQGYVKALSLAFFSRYVRGQESYAVYLTPGYAASLSRDPLPLSFLTELPEDRQ